MNKLPFFPVSIEKLSSKGFGMGAFPKGGSSYPVVVPCTVPGDEVLVEVFGKSKGVFSGKAREVFKPSVDRVVPKCGHASVCGGCSVQQMDYAAQLRYKEGVVAKLFGCKVLPIIPSEHVWNYRNKMEYTFSQNREGVKFLGLIQAASKGRVESLQECHICPEWFIEVLKSVRSWWEDSELAAYNPFRNTGSLRTLTLREGLHTRDRMVILTVSGVAEYALPREQLKKFTDLFAEQAGCSIFLRIQQIAPGSETQFYEMHLSGPAHIEEELEIRVGEHQRKYRFKISPTAFFQPNTLQAQKIYSQSLCLAGVKKRRAVMDLYAGTATLSMIFAPFAEKILAVEINPYAVFDGQMNQELNGVENLEIVKGDVAEVLNGLDAFWNKPDLMLLDPPRAGLSQKALDLILKAAPQEILYISCAPATQSRDCLLLQNGGYEIVLAQPIDQFPHTVHLENIVLLRSKDGLQ